MVDGLDVNNKLNYLKIMPEEKFSESIIQAVWNKGEIVSNFDPSEYRKDKCGALIVRSEYGDRDSKNGWEIDHIDPNGSDNLDNLQPLQWENNVAKSDSGSLKCVVSS